MNILSEFTIDNIRFDIVDLTQRQLAVLFLVCAANPSEPCTIRGMAESLNIGKPSVSRACDALEKHRFVRRVRDELDLRSVSVLPLTMGKVHVKQLSHRLDVLIDIQTKKQRNAA